MDDINTHNSDDNNGPIDYALLRHFREYYGGDDKIKDKMVFNNGLQSKETSPEDDR